MLVEEKGTKKCGLKHYIVFVMKFSRKDFIQIYHLLPFILLRTWGDKCFLWLFIRWCVQISTQYVSTLRSVYKSIFYARSCSRDIKFKISCLSKYMLKIQRFCEKTVKYIVLTEDRAQVGVKRLWWSFYLVWRPSWQEIPGSYHVLSLPPKNYRLLLVITLIKPSFYWLPQWSDQFPILFSLPVGPGKHWFVKMSSSTLCCTVLYI